MYSWLTTSTDKRSYHYECLTKSATRHVQWHHTKWLQPSLHTIVSSSTPKGSTKGPSSEFPEYSYVYFLCMFKALAMIGQLKKKAREILIFDRRDRHNKESVYHTILRQLMWTSRCLWEQCSTRSWSILKEIALLQRLQWMSLHYWISTLLSHWSVTTLEMLTMMLILLL